MTKSITILEPDLRDFNLKTKNLQRFLEVIWVYSFKMRGHFQILAHIINDLVESDDHINLVDMQ